MTDFTKHEDLTNALGNLIAKEGVDIAFDVLAQQLLCIMPPGEDYKCFEMKGLGKVEFTLETQPIKTLAVTKEETCH
ncbi:hypothetical protein [Thalassotalea piscium]|uniref:Uncharacterized protein n=1 Tax=Thalassotalea piscium TaxID=1230533 RepID=A0A7X0NGK5_9GAMM|nr:hypothetical protein [Thalassotalea piscium]MBB6543087.1 hypothetical protein [Thalassotalea piscium]